MSQCHPGSNVIEPLAGKSRWGEAKKSTGHNRGFGQPGRTDAGCAQGSEAPLPSNVFSRMTRFVPHRIPRLSNDTMIEFIAEPVCRLKTFSDLARIEGKIVRFPRSP